MGRIVHSKKQKEHTTEECITENTMTSASEGVVPLPKSIDFWAKSWLNPVRASKHAWQSTGKLSANSIHFITYKESSHWSYSSVVSEHRQPVQPYLLIFFLQKRFSWWLQNLCVQAHNIILATDTQRSSLQKLISNLTTKS